MVVAEVEAVGAAAAGDAAHLGVVAALVRDGALEADAEGAVGRGEDPAVGDERPAAECPICKSAETLR